MLEDEENLECPVVMVLLVHLVPLVSRVILVLLDLWVFLEVVVNLVYPVRRENVVEWDVLDLRVPLAVKVTKDLRVSVVPLALKVNLLKRVIQVHLDPLVSLELPV